MIRYPILSNDATVGVTAPSSGVPVELHHLLHQAREKFQEQNVQVVFGETVWTQKKAKSADAKTRANEFNQMMQNDNVDVIIPPWGGELLIETLEYIDFENIKEKWIVGYSDTSLLLLAITLKTGIATAHGTNFVDLRGKETDPTTAMWKTVLSTEVGSSVVQYSSPFYQKEWKHGNPTPVVFNLTEKTEWKTISCKEQSLKGRLLGGCIDVIRHLAGTPFGNIQSFQQKYIHDEPIIWFFENCELSTTDLRRSLVQMKLAGWFDHCSGVLFGRSEANHSVGDYTVEDVYWDLSEELNVPIIYDIDCGHKPPQVTLINGAFAEVTVENGKGKVTQCFRS
ncbi:LD-carboxypeptidase [Bacillus carboniphilus]|uniref:LD-carboxypeptidase n=1 Tax=Bacillus carboniphilus TaxID=86663 RepID=A0ABY9JS70_9BACI|nr:S66 peptidase family protein [Bacillus carboniphilus]WLR42236.1 LD-carboxypeptidase [Bacillus carboniphilus]